MSTGFFLIYYHKFLGEKKFNRTELQRFYKYLSPPPSKYIKSFPRMWSMVAIFLITIILLVLSRTTGMPIALCGLAGATIAMVIGGEKGVVSLTRLDWDTLIFFAGMFIVVGGLEGTGVTSLLSSAIISISGGSALITVTIIIWVSFLVSAFVDNVPFVVAMVPVLRRIAVDCNIPIGTLAWSLSLANAMGGNATPIGASANMVALSAASDGKSKIGWGEYLRTAVPVTVACIVVLNFIIWFVYI
jgi:Na+/H+ antiporter NhaD/arsenite permease-like protein